MSKKKYIPRAPKVGDVVRVRFWDHAENTNAGIQIAYGEVKSKNRHVMVLNAWRPEDDPGDDTEEKSHTTRFEIVVSTIVDCQVLTEMK